MPAVDDRLHERESDNNQIMMKTLNKKKSERGKSFAPNLKSASKATTVGKFRERTLGLR